MTYTKKIFRHSQLDMYVVSAAILHSIILISGLFYISAIDNFWAYILGAILIALGMAWNANTICHIQLHSGIFKVSQLNRFFVLFLSITTSIPQCIWRDRHLRHHAGDPIKWRTTYGKEAWIQVILILASWLLLIFYIPKGFVFSYLPGFLFGLALCQIQGYFEHKHCGHSIAEGVSYYGFIYNFLFFNDGYHAEHHKWAGRHWSKISQQKLEECIESTKPPLLRWLEKYS